MQVKDVQLRPFHRRCMDVVLSLLVLTTLLNDDIILLDDSFQFSIAL